MRNFTVPLVFMFILTFVAQQAQAGSCVFHVTRVACPGKDKESFSKCDGKASCDETQKVGSAEACAKQAEAACANVGARQQITKSKSVTADFDGAPVQAGKNFCAPERPDFNKCGG